MFLNKIRRYYLSQSSLYLILAVITLGNLPTTAYCQKSYNVYAYGARVTKANNALSIQKAIDAAAANGGGRVVVPAGNFVSGPVKLKSNVELHLSANAIILGSSRRLDFSENSMAVISAQGQHHVAITGKGTIDGQAHLLIADLLRELRAGTIKDELWQTKRPTENNRANLLFFKNCRDIRVTAISLKDAASWVQNYKECDGVLIDSIKVNSTAYWNNDGIDIVDSRNVKIANSFFNAADDAICLKSEIANGYCENVQVENCVLRSSANGFKLGTGSVGGFKNITVKNITVYDTFRSAIALEAVDGGFIEGVDIKHVRAANTGNALFIRLGHRNADARYSTVKNIFVEDLSVDIPSGKPDVGYPFEGPLPKIPPHNLMPASITGLPGHPVQDVKLQNVEITYGGEGSKQKAYINIDSLASVTNNASGYPEFNMFGELPAWGLYVRHTESLTLTNINFKLKKTDFRPALVFDEVSGLKINGVAVPANSELPAVVYRRVEKLITSALTLPAGENAAVTKNK